MTDANLLLGQDRHGVVPRGNDPSRPRPRPGDSRKARGSRCAGIGSRATGEWQSSAPQTAKMERAIRSVSVERGHNPRDYAMICFGGAGALHACELAESLEIPQVSSCQPMRACSRLSACSLQTAYVTTLASVLNEDPRHGLLQSWKLQVARRDMRQQGFEQTSRWSAASTCDTRASPTRSMSPTSRRTLSTKRTSVATATTIAGRATRVQSRRACKPIGMDEGRRIARTWPPVPRISRGFASIHVPNGWRSREAVGSNTILERVGLGCTGKLARQTPPESRTARWSSTRSALPPALAIESVMARKYQSVPSRPPLNRTPRPYGPTILAVLGGEGAGRLCSLSADDDEAASMRPQLAAWRIADRLPASDPESSRPTCDRFSVQPSTISATLSPESAADLCRRSEAPPWSSTAS